MSTVTGLIALVGWILEIRPLTTLALPGDDPVKVTTSIGFILSSGALIAASHERRTWARAYASRMSLGICVLMLGLASLVDRLIGDPSMLVVEPTPYRMSLNTAVALTLLGFSFLSPPSGEHGVWRLAALAQSSDLFSRSGPIVVGWKWWLAQASAAAAAIVGFVAIIGHIYSADVLFGFSPDVNMAFPSAVCVFALGLASFFRESDAAFAAEVTSPFPGGVVLRLVVTSAAVILPLLGWLRLLAQDNNVLDYRLGAALFATTSVLLLAVGMWISARHLNHAASLQRFAQVELSMQANLLEERVRTRTIELRTSEAHFRLLTDASPALIWMTDTTMKFEFVNSVGAAFFGDAQRALGDRWMEFVHPEDLAHVSTTLGTAVKDAAGFEFQMRLRRADGEYRWMHSQGLPRTSASGQLTGFIGASLDITDPHRAREALREALTNREEALAREQTLRRELDHRVRNNLAGLLGLVAFYETAVRDNPSAYAVASTLRGKIQAMKDVHDVIAKAGGSSVDLGDLIRRLLTAMIPDERRTSVSYGECCLIRISAQQASALAIIIQELTTNSFKHGALGCRDGSIQLSWTNLPPAPYVVQFQWLERFAPKTPRELDPEGGVGLTLIDGFARSDLRGQCTFASDHGSWSCTLLARLDPIPETAMRRPTSPQ
ncbi:MAG: PAS domain-containing protein [Planctomycetota bacterium]|nr:PAS domain-containing protein [Planctomycetota bacterium]